MVRLEPTRMEDDNAIQRVLDAERAAEEEVARCDAACNEAVRAARQAAAEVVARAERRLATLRGRIEAAAEERIRALDASALSLPRSDEPTESEHERIARAAAALARELTGTQG